MEYICSNPNRRTRLSEKILEIRKETTTKSLQLTTFSNYIKNSKQHSFCNLNPCANDYIYIPGNIFGCIN